MAKRVEKNHVVESDNEEIALAEELLHQQEEQGDIAFEEVEPELTVTEPEEVEPELSRNIDSKNILILVGAATYLGCGLHFTKNKPVPVADKDIINKLLNTGLFKIGTE